MSTIRANTITDTAGTGAPTFSNGIKTNAILDASGGNTATINGKLPIAIGDVPAAGGMTLLGTLTTTSGTSVTLSGLTLTSYQQIVAVVKNVSCSSNFVLQFSSQNMVNTVTSTNAVFGILTTDLTTGVWVFPASIALLTNTTNNGTLADSWKAGIQNTITTASTSISFGSSSTFNAGSIRIYGVK